MSDQGTTAGKPLIESDRVEGTTVFDREGNDIGSIKRLMIEKLSGQVAYAIMSLVDSWAWGQKSTQFHGES